MSNEPGPPAGIEDDGGVYRRQCGWPGCGKLEGSFGCDTHGITGPSDKDKYDQAGK